MMNKFGIGQRVATEHDQIGTITSVIEHGYCETTYLVQFGDSDDAPDLQEWTESALSAI